MNEKLAKKVKQYAVEAARAAFTVTAREEVLKEVRKLITTEIKPAMSKLIAYEVNKQLMGKRVREKPRWVPGFVWFGLLRFVLPPDVVIAEQTKPKGIPPEVATRLMKTASGEKS